ncbi:MAG TPA: glycosyltransferase family 2 protein, partial [Candidatus Parabacteroides intestinipullorum]|nr:glycosyltransferase family 2 protein [Candidatus Parabacteroides intestinipullorum]
GNIIHLPFRGCCMALKKELLNYILPFPRNIIVHDAWIGIISVLKKGFLIIDDRLIDYRIHANNVSVKKSQNSFFYKIYYRFVILYQAMLRVFHT